MPNQPQSPTRFTFYVLRFTAHAPLIVFTIAFLLRLALLNAAGFWRDEVASLTVAGWGWSDIVGGRFGEVRNQPPGHTLLMRAGLAANAALGGWLPAETAARLPFALAGALTCALLAAWGGRRFGAGAGAVAGLLLATSYGHLFQSTEARPYALLTLATLAALVALDRALDGGPQAARWWAGGVVAGLAGVASSYLMVYAVLPGLGLWAAARLWPLLRAALPARPGSSPRPSGEGLGVRSAARRQLRVPLLAAVVLALGTLPALPEMLRVQWASDRAGNNPADAAVKLLLYNGLSFGPAPGAGWAVALVGLVIVGALTARRAGGAARTV
ncbi:MAG: glycosyltransferase family 39 protein, partial [Chloroflexota bacterium]|nr:glycosyltransferase family 39 protein [Chloroflexota bacterium]